MKQTMFKNSMMALATAFIMNATANAQIQLPAPSPKASVMQTAGLTDITIDYSSPAVKGRVVWGDLVPYRQVWRAGANSATKITFSKDVTIEGVSVPKGSYSIFVTPVENVEWMIMINKDATASVDAYKAENNIATIKTKPEAIAMKERLAFSITDFNDASATVNLEWEKMRVSFKVMLGTDKQAEENITSAVSGASGNYRAAARYMLDTKKDYDKTLSYINQSLALNNDQWFGHWIKAQALKGKGMNKEAYEAAMKSKELGDKNPDGFFFKADVDKAVNDWKPTAKKK